MGIWMPLESPLSSISLHITPYPSISQAFPPRNASPNACSFLTGRAQLRFRARHVAFGSPGDNHASRRRSRSAQCGNQRSKHVSTVDLSDSGSEDGIGSLMAEEAIDGVGG